MLKIQNLDGCLDKVLNYNGESGETISINLKDNKVGKGDSLWNFFRKASNYSYVQDEFEGYSESCKNNVIIALGRNIKLENICNAFIILDGSCLEISPIFNVKEGVDKAKNLLRDKKIKYNIPESVFERINLSEKNKEDIEKQIWENYELKLSGIQAIREGRANDGIFYLKDIRGKEFILKYRGRSKQKVENLFKLFGNIPNYFPEFYLTKTNSSPLFNFGEEIYGLEKFISNDFPKERNLNYISLIGQQIGLLHNDLRSFLKKEKRLIDSFEYREGFLNESSMIAVCLDLYLGTSKESFLLSEIENLINSDFLGGMKYLPRSLIHKDLNYSNILWPSKLYPKIIDSETMGNSIRINEFISPLFFEGNMAKPNYLVGGMENIFRTYNKFSEVQLSKEEMAMLNPLLKYSILTNYVVRKIRRNGDEAEYLSNIKKNLKHLNLEYKNDK